MNIRNLLRLITLITLLGSTLLFAGAAVGFDLPGLPTLTPIYLPLVMGEGRAPTPTPTLRPPSPEDEWSQHAHDAQHSGYTPQVVPYPWRWRWAWNGPGANGGLGGKVTSDKSLPRNVQPVTGDGRVYVAAGIDGVFALAEDNGQQVWQRTGLGDVRSTVAYDRDTRSVFALAANGRLYKLRASDGAVLGQYASGQSSTLPLPPAVLSDRVLFAMGSSVYALDKETLQVLWSYNSGATIATPPAYSPSRNVVIVATEPDLYVHAINNTDGSRKWHMRPVHSNRNFSDPTEFRYGWPVVAENAGYVLVRVRLDAGDNLYRVWPRTNSGMRQMLTTYPGDQVVFVLDLDDGSNPFIAHIGSGGYGDGGYLPMGPQPVVKPLPNGKDVVYTVIRAEHERYMHPWNSYFGEMMLDNSTVSDLQGGYVRFIYFDYPPGDPTPYLLTDEQPNISMAGDYLFGGHWEAGFALRILDRSDQYGSFSNRIPTQRLATLITSQDWTGSCAFSPSHYCPAGLHNTRFYDFGFYIYYNKGAVYDQFWSEYAIWVVSNENVYFRSCDGAIVALTSGTPQAASLVETSTTLFAPPATSTTESLIPIAVIPYTEAHAWAGQTVTVQGTLRYVYNNQKYVLLGFANPHQGTFKVLIRRAEWERFPQPPDLLYRLDQSVQVTGVITWYQGDPAMYISDPQQIQVMRSEQ